MRNWFGTLQKVEIDKCERASKMTPQLVAGVLPTKRGKHTLRQFVNEKADISYAVEVSAKI